MVDGGVVHDEDCLFQPVTLKVPEQAPRVLPEFPASPTLADTVGLGRVYELGRIYDQKKRLFIYLKKVIISSKRSLWRFILIKSAFLVQECISSFLQISAQTPKWVYLYFCIFSAIKLRSSSDNSFTRFSGHPNSSNGLCGIPGFNFSSGHPGHLSLNVTIKFSGKSLSL